MRQPTTRIVVAMIVENAGFGAQHAAPIARRAFDYWLMGLYPTEEDMAAVRQGQAATPIGKPRNAADVAWPPGGADAVDAAVNAAAAFAPIVAVRATAPASAAAVVAPAAAVKTEAP
jgi:penicillin-binding protein 2